MLQFRQFVALFYLLAAIFIAGSPLQAQTVTPFELDPARNSSATYAETIAFYEALATRFPDRFQFQPFGMTDSGHPLHVGVLAGDGRFTPEMARAAGKIVVFVNNGIHAGEPCGVDATQLLVRDHLEQPAAFPWPEDVVLVFIPFYNIGGALNRGAYSRANQAGPAEHGFRGNARNLDLNRDFIKCDSRNAQSFNQLFTRWQPEIFVDNHTSNGADYQYTLTLIPTQHNKLSAPLSDYLQETMLPQLYTAMESRGWPMTPYVNVRDIPDNGIAGFLDLPRYSSGYAALHHSLSFMPETHMLKPFGDRVRSIYEFMGAMLALAQADRERIQQLRREAIARDRRADQLAIDWTLAGDRVDSLLFRGYTARYRPSAISGLDRLYYDREAPFTKSVPFYNTYRASATASRPRAYLIPQAYGGVLDRLRWNGVELHQLQRDTALAVVRYRIADYETSPAPYESHYLHRRVELDTLTEAVSFRAGDYVVFTDQPAVRYLVETLEPRAPDSFFAWNFFDGILQQKEYFSSYVFEDLAAAYLADHPDLAAELERAKADDPEMAASARAQLDFIYRHSPYYEPTHRVYPVARWQGRGDLPLD